MLKIQDLTKIYGDGTGEVVAVNHLTCTVNDGDFVSIIGKSGCGKSTFLHLLAGLDRPTSGKIFFNDIDIEFENDLITQETLLYTVNNLIDRGILGKE